MQTDADMTLQMKLTHNLPKREIEIEKEAKAPDVSGQLSVKIRLFLKKFSLFPVFDEQFINQLEANGPYEQFWGKQLSDDRVVNITGFFSLSLIRRGNLIETNDFEDIWNDLANRTHPLDLVREQQFDEVIRELFHGKLGVTQMNHPTMRWQCESTENILTA